MHIQALRLEGSETIGDRQELLAHGGQMVKAFLEPEVGQIVRADLIAQEGGELLVLLDEAVFPIGAEDMMSVLDLLEGGVELALEFLGDAAAEDLRDLVGRQPPESELTTALEDPVNREVTFEDEVAAVLDLGDGVEAAQVHLLAFLVGELRSQDQSPVVQTLPDDLGAEPVGRGLQGLHIVYGQEGIVVLAEADLGAIQLLFDEGVAVQLIGRLEGEEGGHAHHHRAQDFIPNIEVVVREAAALRCEDAVIGILRRILRDRAPEVGPCSMLLKMK